MGLSGVGKTRFAYEVFRDRTSIPKSTASYSAIYCDYRTVGSQLLSVSESLVEFGKPTLLIVDECPRDVASQLAEIVLRGGSKLESAIGLDDRGRLILDLVMPAEWSFRRVVSQSGSSACLLRFVWGLSKFAVLATDDFARSGSILV